MYLYEDIVNIFKASKSSRNNTDADKSIKNNKAGIWKDSQRFTSKVLFSIIGEDTSRTKKPSESTLNPRG